jgi:hypothetical protein
MDAEKIRQLGKQIADQTKGQGFCLLVFPFHTGGMSNYITNANRHDMIKALFETAEKLMDGEDFPTPESN